MNELLLILLPAGLFLIDLFLKATLLIGVVWVLTLTLRSSAASLRHHLWLISLITVLTLPLASTLVPSVPLQWGVGDLFSIQDDSLGSPTPPPSRGPETSAGTARGATLPETIERSEDSRAASSPVPHFHLLPLLLSTFGFVWAFGTIALLLRLLLDLRALSRLIDRAKPFPIGGSTLSRQVFESFVPGREAPALKTSREVTIPFAWGFPRPIIFLPASAREWDGRRLECVLRHEAAHLSRKDSWSVLTGRIARALFWLHPLVHLAVRNLAEERERACDDAVLLGGVKPTHYARELVSFSRDDMPVAGFRQPAFSHRKNKMVTRITAVLKPALRRDTASKPFRLFTGCVAVVVVLLVAQVDLMGRQSDHDIEQELYLDHWIAALDDPSSRIRAHAAHMLGDIRDPRALAALRLASDDPNHKVRDQVGWAIRELSQVQVALLLQQPIKAGSWNDPDPDVRVLVAHELGDRRDRGGTALLLQLLSDANPAVRERAAWALGEVRDPASVSALVRVALSAEEDIEVRRQAIRALGEIRDDSAVPTLLNLLGSDHGKLRSQSADALGDIGSATALPALRTALKDRYGSVRENARKSIQKIEN